MQARRTFLHAALAACLLVSCAPQQAFTPRLTSEPVETPTPEPALEGSPTLSPQQGWEVIGEAFATLLSSYVEPPDPAALLRAAWEGFSATLPAGQPRPEPPALSGADPREDLLRFRAAYVDAASQVAGGPDTQARLAYASIRRMAASLADCHTSFSDPLQAQEQAARASGEARFGGIGIRIKRRPDNSILIWELIDGGSAGKAGIKPGDAIVKVEGRETAGMTLEQIAGLIRGPEDSQVKLTVERADGKKVQDFTLKRVRIAEPAFESALLPGGVAYLRLYSFSPAAETQLLQAIREYESKNPRGWIVDLRTNPGGPLQVLLSLLSKFLKDGPFGYEVDRRGQRAAFGPDGTYLPRQRPLVVMVSDSTSSAAELFASAIQHYRAGALVGTKTAGCLGIGNRYELSDGSQLSVTVRRLLGPAANELNRAGVAPDEVVEVSRGDLAAGKDPQLQRALTILGAPPR